MTETLTKIIVDCSTGDVQELPLTEEEIAEREAMAAQAEADRLVREAEETAKAEAKASALAKLQALGLSEDEAKALVGA